MLKHQNNWQLLFIMLFILSGLNSGFADDFIDLPITFTAHLSSEQLMPPVATNASGYATAVLFADQLVVTGSYTGLSSEVYGQGHFLGVLIHRAAAGRNGGVVTTEIEQLYPGLHAFMLMSDGGTTGRFSGNFRLNKMQVDELINGLYYIAIHTESHLPGELRGQLIPSVKLELNTRDLVGVWEKPSSTLPSYYQFDEDGHYRVSTGNVQNLQAYPVEQGDYRLTGNTFTFTSHETNSYCPSATGSYAIMLTNNHQLRFFPREDECPFRQSDLLGWGLQLVIP